MSFFDSRLVQCFTAAGLRQRGLPIDHDLLAEAGIYPLRCTPPDYD